MSERNSDHFESRQTWFENRKKKSFSQADVNKSSDIQYSTEALCHFYFPEKICFITNFKGENFFCLTQAPVLKTLRSSNIHSKW